MISKKPVKRSEKLHGENVHIVVNISESESESDNELEIEKSRIVNKPLTHKKETYRRLYC